MKKFLILIALALITGCQQANKPDLEAEVAALRKEAESYHEHATAGHFDMIKAYYAAEAKIMAPGMGTIQGQQAVQEWANGFGQLKNFKVSFSAPEVAVEPDGMTGYSTANATLSYDISEGRTDTETIRDFHVWKKQADGSWKISVDVWNETDAGGEGVFEYLPPLMGLATIRNGTYITIYAPVDGKGQTISAAGTYTLSGDTATGIRKYCSDPKLVGTSFRWRLQSSSGDTVTYANFNPQGKQTGGGRAVRISN